jgi:phosphate transport system substrate-binding protein
MYRSHLVASTRISLAGVLVAVIAVAGPVQGQSPAASLAVPPPEASGAPSPGVVSSATCVDGSLDILASTTVFPTLVAAVDTYQAMCPGSAITVGAPGSGAAINGVLAGDVDIAVTSTRADETFTPEQVAQLAERPLLGIWAMVTGRDVTGITGLTQKQARNVWSGKVTDWKEVGGPDLPITLVERDESAAHEVLKQAILGKADQAAGQSVPDSDRRALEALAGVPGGIALIGLPSLPADGSVNVLTLDDVAASATAVADGSYPLSGTIGHIYTLGPAVGLAAAFLDHLQGVTATVASPSMLPVSSPGGSAAP